MYDISPEDYLNRYHSEKNLRNHPQTEVLKKKQPPAVKAEGTGRSWPLLSALSSFLKRKYCEDDLGTLRVSPC